MSILYQRTHFIKTNFSTLEWFALEPKYGMESYGPIVNIYFLDKTAKLLDIGKEKNRNYLIKISNEKNHEINAKLILDPDEQYSGGSANKKAHQLIKKLVGDYYDGTIIKETTADTNLEGPTEVVLWNFNKINKL